MSSTPERFSKKFFKDIIQKEFLNEVQILNVETSSFLSPGENYCCDVLRIAVKFCIHHSNAVQSMSFISKRLLDVDIVQQFDEETGVFYRELTVYRDILPRLEKLGENKKIAPKLYYFCEKPELLILEDLVPLNYKMCKRQDGFDLEHCLIIMQKLAYYHATSLAIYEKDPKMITKYNKGAFYKCKSLEILLSTTFREALKVCQREPSLHKYIDKINNDLLESSYNITQRDPSFNVLNHGDFWLNNLLFKYNENGYVEDVLFVDFQMTAFTSPHFDLHLFFATSTNLEVKKIHMNSILNCYYDTFCKHAESLKLKTQIPKRRQFQDDFCKKAHIGLIIAYTHMPIIKSDNRKDASFMNFVHHDGEGSFRHHCYNNNNFLTNFKCLLSIYEEMGLFKT